MCKLYDAPDANTTDEAHPFLFKKAMELKLLPHTSDAAKNHIKRAPLQTINLALGQTTKTYDSSSNRLWMEKCW